MSKIKRYLKGSPGIYTVVGFIINKARNFGYSVGTMKIANVKPLKFSVVLSLLPIKTFINPEKIKRYIQDAPSKYKVLGYHLLKPDYEGSGEYRSKLLLSRNENPLKVHAILREMVKVAI